MTRNVIPLASGRVRLVCQYCDRRSSSRAAAGLGDLPHGWWMAPYPAEHVHTFDGSTGSLFTCPDCAKSLIGRRPLAGRGA